MNIAWQIWVWTLPVTMLHCASRQIQLSEPVSRVYKGWLKHLAVQNMVRMKWHNKQSSQCSAWNMVIFHSMLTACHYHYSYNTCFWSQQHDQSDWSKINFFLMFLFIFETERDRAWAGEGERERETQNPKQAPGSELSTPSPMWGSNHKRRDHDLSQSWTPNPLSHPGAPAGIFSNTKQILYSSWCNRDSLEIRFWRLEPWPLPSYGPISRYWTSVSLDFLIWENYSRVIC